LAARDITNLQWFVGPRGVHAYFVPPSARATGEHVSSLGHSAPFDAGVQLRTHEPLLAQNVSAQPG
jgi:hypothetical protein